MENIIKEVSKEEFEFAVACYRQVNPLLENLLNIKGSWENLPDHLIKDLFKRVECKPIIKKY